MRQIDLFELMNAYTDEEFAPKEECLVDEHKRKDLVSAQVRQKARKRRKVLVLAAVLAACLALAGWSYGDRIYQFLSGSQLTISASAGMGSGTVTMTDGLDEEGNPTIVSLEEGRLWFVAAGQREDITDLVDENTPYVYTIDENGALHYFIVGGTPEDYGWFEGVTFPDGSGGGSGIAHSRTDLPADTPTPVWWTNGEEQVRELLREQRP